MHFWMSQAISWMKKNSKKFFSNFSFFHRGDPYVFSQISSKILRWNLLKNFKKNRKGPPYEKWKNLKKIFLNFFHPRYSLGHPKMHIGSFFQKSLRILECLLFGAGEIWIVMPLFYELLRSILTFTELPHIFKKKVITLVVIPLCKF